MPFDLDPWSVFVGCAISAIVIGWFGVGALARFQVIRNKQQKRNGEQS